MEILVFLAFFVLIPIIMMLVGLIMVFNSDPIKSKKGRNYLLYGFIILLVELLIGYALCSNMEGSFH